MSRISRKTHAALGEAARMGGKVSRRQQSSTEPTRTAVSAATALPLMTVAVVDNWRAIAAQPLPLEVANASIHAAPLEVTAARRFLLSVQPAWLLVGDEGDEAMLAALVTAARSVLPHARLAVVGSAQDLDRCDRWLRLGATAYLGADAPSSRVIEVLRAALALDTDLVDDRFQRLARSRHADASLAFQAHILTPREREVLCLIRRGLKNTAIADALSVSESTIEYHVGRILSKLGVENRTEAAVRATLIGI